MVTIAAHTPPGPDPERESNRDPLAEKFSLLLPLAGMTPEELRAAVEEDGYTTKEEELFLAMVHVSGRIRKKSVDQSAAPEVDHELLRAYLLGKLPPDEHKKVSTLTYTYTAWNDAGLRMIGELGDQMPPD